MDPPKIPKDVVKLIYNYIYRDNLRLPYQVASVCRDYYDASRDAHIDRLMKEPITYPESHWFIRDTDSEMRPAKFIMSDVPNEVENNTYIYNVTLYLDHNYYERNIDESDQYDALLEYYVRHPNTNILEIGDLKSLVISETFGTYTRSLDDYSFHGFASPYMDPWSTYYIMTIRKMMIPIKKTDLSILNEYRKNALKSNISKLYCDAITSKGILLIQTRLYFEMIIHMREAILPKTLEQERYTDNNPRIHDTEFFWNFVESYEELKNVDVEQLPDNEGYINLIQQGGMVLLVHPDDKLSNEEIELLERELLDKSSQGIYTVEYFEYIEESITRLKYLYNKIITYIENIENEWQDILYSLS
jgi:hypothetical protein